MELNISKNGDALEREFSNMILTYLPSYNEIWKIYIGHDGNGKMLKIQGLSTEQEKLREKFSQYHYTCLESLVGMKIIIENSKKYSYDHIRDVIRQKNEFLTFHTLAGKIRDSIKVLGELYQLPNLYLKFEKSWLERCIIVHKKSLPFAIIEGLYLVLKDPRLIENTENETELSWYDFSEQDFTFLNDTLENSVKELICQLNSSLFILLEKIKKLQNETDFTLVLNETNDKYSNLVDQLIISGSCIQNQTFNINNQSSTDFSSVLNSKSNVKSNNKKLKK